MTHYVLITTKDRVKFLHNCLESIRRTTPETKIFVVSDGSNLDTIEYITNSDYIEGYVINKTNIGIAPSIEIGLHLINNYHRFRFNEGLEEDKDPWISYVQDDVEFIKEDWVHICVDSYLGSFFNGPQDVKGIGFITGHVAPEHANSSRGFAKCILDVNTPQAIEITYEFRDHIRATHMMTQLSFWLEQLPITVNGELNIPRGHPGNGRGSDIDWYFLRGHDKSVLKRGMTNLVIPGILKHIGYEYSTWQSNVLPEVS